MNMSFYFIKDEFFEDFPDKGLMINREKIDNAVHNRPCFYAYKDVKNELYWMIPVTSQVEKYKKIYIRKVEKFKRCDNLVFAKFLDKEAVFLIQNIFPVTDKYILNQYFDKNNKPIEISYKLSFEIRKKAKHVIRGVRLGIKGLVFPDILKIEETLIKEKRKAAT